MTPRRILFWIHLTAGSLAGIVILIMCVSGVLLAFERQIVNFADRQYRSTPEGKSPLPLDQLLAKVRESESTAPSAITLKSEPDAPVQLSYGRDRTLLIDPYDGRVLGESAPRLRAFFSGVEGWHRYLGASGASRTAGRAVTGASNLLFLILVSSGPFLWWPKDWSWGNVKKIVLFRGGLSGRARDWNWHNVIGLWCCVPLFFVVLTGVVMSYPWANNLLYRLTGNEPPQQQAGPPGARPEGAGRAGGRKGEPAEEVSLARLDAFFSEARQRVPNWRTITLRIPSSAKAPLVFSVDEGNGGRPDLRSQLTIDPKTGEVTRWEPFSSYNSGRRLRMWGRFLHTGEAVGLFGQSIAALASAGAAVLVWTGLALALRRWNQWRKRRSSKPEAVAAGV